MVECASERPIGPFSPGGGAYPGQIQAGVSDKTSVWAPSRSNVATA
jgi:hypothetical protein